MLKINLSPFFYMRLHASAPYAVVTSLVLGFSVATAGAAAAGKEADKAQAIKAILQKQTMYPQVSINDPVFCDPLLNALENASPRIEYIEPVLKTSNPEHPGLAHYHRCDGHEYPGGPPDNAFDTLSAIGQNNFRLYRIDLDNNPKNGIEEVIYGEVEWENTYGMDQVPGYSIIDLERCEFKKGGVPVYQRERPEGRVFENHNAVIRYQQHYYVVDLYNVGGEPYNPMAYRLAVYGFRSHIKNAGKAIGGCAWSWREDPLNKKNQEK